ncbi:ATP-binding protein, partial [Patescibacteria group bacterium]|nr:ATP-binding protein [Patescibacteria group bacterium]
GIPENDQKFIFVKFFRALNALKHNTEGSGLGLYIAKKIAEKHNADLFFESVENQGSEFVFQFPLEAERMPKIAIADEEFKNA